MSKAVFERAGLHIVDQVVGAAVSRGQLAKLISAELEKCFDDIMRGYEVVHPKSVEEIDRRFVEGDPMALSQRQLQADLAFLRKLIRELEDECARLRSRCTDLISANRNLRGDDVRRKVEERLKP